MSTDEFTQLFNYMEKLFGELEAKMDTRFDETNSRIDRIISSPDALANARRSTSLVMGYQLERLDRWVHQLAKKIGSGFVSVSVSLRFIRKEALACEISPFIREDHSNET